MPACCKTPAKKAPTKKRVASPEASSSSSSSSSRNVRGRGGLDPGRRDNTGYTYSPGSHPNQRGGWIPNFTRGGHCGRIFYWSASPVLSKSPLYSSLYRSFF